MDGAGGPHNAVFVVWGSVLRMGRGSGVPTGHGWLVEARIPASELAGYFRWSLRDLLLRCARFASDFVSASPIRTHVPIESVVGLHKSVYTNACLRKAYLARLPKTVTVTSI
jgi:hypothetical protein